MPESSTYLSTGEGTVNQSLTQQNLDAIQELTPVAQRTHLQDVINFHEHFKLGDDANAKPGFISAGENLDLVRVRFLQEELNEYAYACGFEQYVDAETGDVQWDEDRDLTPDLEKALDGLVDLQYVLLGTVHLHGFAPIWEQAWSRVQEANMSKVLVESAEDSKRGTTHDVKKPEGWDAPQFKDLLFY